MFKGLELFVEKLNKACNNIDLILKRVDQGGAEDKKALVTNEEFIREMGISKRTAQRWRDEGLISFSQVGRKIYYQKSDVDAFIEKQKNPAFK